MSDMKELIEFQNIMKSLEKGMMSAFKEYLKQTKNETTEIENVTLKIDSVTDAEEYVDMDLAIILTLRMKKNE